MFVDLDIHIHRKFEKCCWYRLKGLIFRFFPLLHHASYPYWINTVYWSALFQDICPRRSFFRSVIVGHEACTPLSPKIRFLSQLVVSHIACFIFFIFGWDFRFIHLSSIWSISIDLQHYQSIVWSDALWYGSHDSYCSPWWLLILLDFCKDTAAKLWDIDSHQYNRILGSDGGKDRRLAKFRWQVWGGNADVHRSLGDLRMSYKSSASSPSALS